MSHSPFFSIVIPIYNRQELVHQTIGSVLQQRFSDFEIILCDDGSTDNTLAILQEKYGSNPKTRIETGPNAERGATRNKGFLLSKGKYVVFFDSDDLMHANHLDVLHKKILEQNFPVLIATKFDFADHAGNRRNSDMHPLREGFYDYHLFLNGNPLACNVCVKRESPGLTLFEEDRNFAIKEDWMFLIKNTMTLPLFIVDEVTITMLDHPQRSMRSDNQLIIRRTMAARDRILRETGITGKDARTLSAHVNYFCGIHAYLDKDKKAGIRFSMEAIKTGGMKFKYLLLLAKCILGKKLVGRLK